MKTGKFIKIQDGVIIKKESLSGYRKDKYDPKGCHYYIAIYNKKRKAYDMYPTSHYVDPSKRKDVKRGNAILMNIKGADGISTVYKRPKTVDVNNQRFYENFSKYESVGRLSDYQIKRLNSFSKSK